MKYAAAEPIGALSPLATHSKGRAPLTMTIVPTRSLSPQWQGTPKSCNKNPCPLTTIPRISRPVIQPHMCPIRFNFPVLRVRKAVMSTDPVLSSWKPKPSTRPGMWRSPFPPSTRLLPTTYFGTTSQNTNPARSSSKPKPPTISTTVPSRTPPPRQAPLLGVGQPQSRGRRCHSRDLPPTKTTTRRPKQRG